MADNFQIKYAKNTANWEKRKFEYSGSILNYPNNFSNLIELKLLRFKYFKQSFTNTEKSFSIRLWVMCYLRFFQTCSWGLNSGV